jgi:dihydroorotase-like cyclic amidohydrolase
MRTFGSGQKGVEMLDLLIRNATIVDGQSVMRGALGVQGERIMARFGQESDLPQAHRVIDAGDLVVMPGVVDPHVHFYGEGIGGFSLLAARGGVTTYFGMMRGSAEDVLGEVFNRHLADGESASVVDFSFHVCLYDRPDTVAQLPALAAQGLRSYKFFLAYKSRGMMSSEAFLHEAFEEIHKLGGLALVHSEAGEMIDRLERAAIEAGRRGPEDYAPTRPPAAEAAAIGTVALAAETTGCEAYIVHVTSSEALAAVEEARRRGVLLWAETCPQYLIMDNDALRTHGPAARIGPPLRGAADRRALRVAVQTGAINTIGSDHASYSREAKARGNANIFDAPMGMPVAPAMLPSMLTWATQHGVPLPVVVRAMSETPARIFGLAGRKGSLTPGADADIVLVDMQSRRSVAQEQAWAHVCPSPVVDEPLIGWPAMTISRGEVVWADGAVQGRAGRGRFLLQSAS